MFSLIILDRFLKFPRNPWIHWSDVKTCGKLPAVCGKLLSNRWITSESQVFKIKKCFVKKYRIDWAIARVSEHRLLKGICQVYIVQCLSAFLLLKMFSWLFAKRKIGLYFELRIRSFFSLFGGIERRMVVWGALSFAWGKLIEILTE